MATDKGVIQGYTGVAAVDAKHQIIVDAQAHGTGSEQELLLPVVEALAALRTSDTVLTADAGYHSEANLAALAAREVAALIADPDMRKRDERFADREHHTTVPNPLHDKTSNATPSSPVFTPNDFTYDADARTCVCPAGQSLYRKGSSNVTNGYVGEHFRGAKRDCAPCALRDQCLRTPETTVVRNVAFFRGRVSTEAEPSPTETHTMRMQQRLDAPEGREQYGQRPVAALLPGAQHRKAHPRGLRGVNRKTRARARNRARGQTAKQCAQTGVEHCSFLHDVHCCTTPHLLP